jgi:hypothetical protein
MLHGRFSIERFSSSSSSSSSSFFFCSFFVFLDMLLQLLVQAEVGHRRAAKKAEKDSGRSIGTGKEQSVWKPSDRQRTCHVELHGLTPKQRALLHEAAVAVGMEHESRDAAGGRILYLGSASSDVSILSAPLPLCVVRRRALTFMWPLGEHT